jgi:hypothetical protein
LIDAQILSEFDVYAVVGGNRPLHVRDIRVTVESDGAFVINFKGVRGSPMVCAICFRKRVAIAGKTQYIRFNLLLQGLIFR